MDKGKNRYFQLKFKMNDLIKRMNEFAKHYEKKLTNKLNHVLTIKKFCMIFDCKVHLN